MKLVVSVSKTHIHRGNHAHRPNTRKRWHIYYYDEEGNFCTQRVSFFEALYYKLNKCKRIKVYCESCDTDWLFVIPRRKKPICPNCQEVIE